MDRCEYIYLLISRIDWWRKTSGQRVFLLWALDYKDGSALERPLSLPFWVSLLNNYALVHMWKITKITCLSLHLFSQNFPSTNPLPTRISQKTNNLRSYKVPRQNDKTRWCPLPPPQPPLVSQSKYFSLFSNPDSCKNSSIVIILIIIYKNRSSFSLFLSFSKRIFFFKQRDLFSLATVLFFFFS